ncbi:hypothetical protein ACA910_010486 [Epithemia clementina (nom. ined.)]
MFMKLTSILFAFALRTGITSAWLLQQVSVSPTTTYFPFRRLSSASATSSPPLSASSISATSSSTIIQGPELPPVAATAKRLFFVRHGEVKNPGGDRPVFYGALDVSLSPLGEEEAIAAGDYLSQFVLSHVFCSPLKRAIFGAEKVLEGQANKKALKSKTPVVFDGFTELERGEWCGKTKDEIGEELMARFDACDESVTPAGGESFPALKRRVMEALHQALGQHMQMGDVGAIVSHLQVTRCILSEAMNIPTNEMVNIKIATASVTCIDYDGETNQPLTVHFQSFKPNVGLAVAKDGAN